MLVVSRKENESITIEPADGIDPSLTVSEAFAHGPIVLTVAHVASRRVRITIDAPRLLKILRTVGGAETRVAEATPRRTGSGS